MKLSKAREILQLNIDQHSKKMPPGVLDALKLHLEASARIISSRDPHGVPPYTLLPEEDPE